MHIPLLSAAAHPGRRCARIGTRAVLALTLAGLLGPGAHAAVSQAALQSVPPPFYGARADVDQLASQGFTEVQFVLSGNAQKYKQSGTWGKDGKWGATVVSSANPYTTAMIVRRPIDPAKFNGVVVVEWLNVSTGYPLDVDWGMTREALIRDGYAYVGVNVQKVGVEGVLKLKQYGDKYQTGSIPDDKLSFDIFSQAGKAVRDQAATVLGGLQPKVVIATGHSQSAGALITYANAIQPLEGVFDGIFIHGRSSSGLKLSSTDSLPSSTALRSDTRVPIFMLQSEWDASLGSATSKQVDTDKLRHWEVAGTSHADQYLLDSIGQVSDREVGWTPPQCTRAYNSAPFYMVQSAALHHLKEWIVQGTLPPVAPRMQRDFFGSLKKDKDGNVIGGLRLPELQVPVAKYGTTNSTKGSLAFLDLFACSAGGSTVPFTASRLAELYPTHDDYVSKFTAAADKAVADGYIRQVDRDTAVRRAQAAAIPK